jgi:predicted permease
LTVYLPAFGATNETVTVPFCAALSVTVFLLEPIETVTLPVVAGAPDAVTRTVTATDLPCLTVVAASFAVTVGAT